MSLAKGLLLLNSSSDPEELFYRETKFLKRTSSDHHVDIFSIISFLDKSDSYSGYRKWYSELAEKYWKPQKSKFEAESRDKAEEILSSFSILITGARPDEIILGTETQSKDAVMKLSSAIVPPKTQVLDTLRKYEDLWETFISRLGNIEYFGNLSRVERKMWLEEYQSENDIYLENVSGLEVEILSFGNSDFLKLDEENLQILGEYGNIFDIREIFDVFPKKPGSNGIEGRHTLIFRRSIWKISTIYQEKNKFIGTSIFLEEGEIKKSSNAKKGEIIFIFDSFAKSYSSKDNKLGKKFSVNEKQKIAIKFKKDKMNLTEIGFYSFFGGWEEEMNMVKKATKNFTAAGFKSLIQKVIRFRPINIELEADYLMDSETFLKCAIAFLMINPGSFVPDIQRFVSGIESALKRVVVSLFEDAYLYKDDEKDIFSIITGSYLAQRVQGWKPSSSLIKKVMDISIRGLRSSTAFVILTSVEKRKEGPFIIDPTSKPLEATSAIMDELRSFGGDLTMIRNIANDRYSKSEEVTKIITRPEKMPVCHCIDQHWAPEIAYMYPVDFLEEIKDKGSQPFSSLFTKIFSEVTGVNPRRPARKGKHMNPLGYSKNFEDREFVKMTRNAQKLILEAKQCKSMKRKNREGNFKFEYEINSGWISGVVGAIEIKGRPIALVTLHPDDPTIFIAIRKPSRDMDTPFLTEEREVEAINEAKKILKKGIIPKELQFPISELKGQKITYDEDKNTFFFSSIDGKVKRRWEDVKKGEIILPYIEDIYSNISNAFLYEGDGITADPFKKLRKIMTRTESSYIQKALTYIGNYSSEFEFKRIGRDGGGTKGSVSVDDVGAFQFIMKIKTFFPSAIKRAPGSALKFRVGLAPLLWLIKDKIVEYLKENKETKINKELWGDTGDKIERKVRDYQSQSIEELKRAHISGKRGSFIWIPVRMGKTFIVLSYLKWLQSIDFLPKYVIYTLPSSAIESIIEEIKNFGFRYRLMIPTKTVKNIYKECGKLKKGISQGCSPLEYTINLVEHDHLRFCEEKLVEYIPNSIFIIDEVHKTMNETKRTSVTLQLSHLAREFIAMTGTPIIDSHTYKLIGWLSQIVSFEVNEKNFWVAANGMISRRVDSGVDIDRLDILFPMNGEEEKEYQSLVSESLGGKNSQPRSEDIKKALEISYEVCDKGIIDEITKGLTRGGVFVVAKNSAHQMILKEKIKKNVEYKNRKIKDGEIFLIGKGDSIFLTNDSVRDKKILDYKIVITTIRHVEGYSVSRLNTMISGVYPSNNATREQVEGRIIRVGEPGKKYYRTIHSGILTYVLKHHNDTRNLSSVLSTLAEKI